MAQQASDRRPPGDRVRSGARRQPSRRDIDEDEYSRTRLVEGGDRSRVDDIRRGNGTRQADPKAKDGRSRDVGSGGDGRRRDSQKSGRNGRESGSSLIAEIENQTARLKQELQGRRSVPWDRSVEKIARQLRTAHLVLLIEHHTNPSAQNIDQIWMTTSYWIISAYRTMISEVEKKVAAASTGGMVEGDPRFVRRNGSRRGTSVEGNGDREKEKDSGPVELRKLLQRFQRFLTTEITFYQWLIRKLIQRFDLFGKHVNAAELKSYLEMLNEGLESSDKEGSEGENGFLNPRSSDEARDPSQPPERLATLDFSTLHLTREETHKKLQLVHKSLLCLGDISRYKELYGPERERKRQERILAEGGSMANKGKRNGKAGPAGARLKENEERFARAKQYYLVAKGFLPDNGNPFNQLAVISVEIGDTFDAIYHYHRALAVSQPFKSAGHNLQRSLDKARRDWKAYVHEEKATKGGDEVVVFDPLVKDHEVDGFKNEEVIMQAVDGQAEISGPDLTDSHLDHLATLIKDRILPSAIIVKTVVLAIAADWNTMMDQLPAPATGGHASDPQHRLAYCLAISQTVCQVALEEVQSCLDGSVLAALANDKSVPVPATISPITNGEVDINLSVNITAALRRMLPALRIISKWLKGNVTRLARAEQDGGKLQEEVEIFASTYTDLLRHMEALFPLEQLPKLYDPLEEDYDMKGFSPVKRGMMDSCAKVELDKAQDRSPRHASDVHPNEEQLMRISDILLDGKLILFQAEAKKLFGVPSTDSGIAMTEERMVTNAEISTSSKRLADLNLVHSAVDLPMPPTLAPVESRAVPEADNEIASVSTETEDDPVNMAMRATLGEGSSVGDDDEMNDKDVDEEEEEQMVWGGRNAPTPPMAMLSESQALRGSPSATAFDLLNNLIHGSVATSRLAQASSPTHPSFSEQPRPLGNRLFGGNVGSIWAPAVGEVNLVGDMARSRSGSGAGFPRVQRDMAHSPSPWGTPDVNRTPQQDASNSFGGSPTVPEHFANRRSVDRNGSLDGDLNGASFMPFG